MRGIRSVLQWLGLIPGDQIFYIGGSDILPAPLKGEEEQIALEALEQGEEGAKQRLIEHNLRLVVFIARRFENTGVNLEDLISIGTIGLIKGISTFDPTKSTRLATYAARCVENVTLSPTTLTHGGRWRVVGSGLNGGFWSGFRRICTSFPGRRILG